MKATITDPSQTKLAHLTLHLTEVPSASENSSLDSSDASSPLQQTRVVTEFLDKTDRCGVVAKYFLFLFPLNHRKSALYTPTKLLKPIVEQQCEIRNIKIDDLLFCDNRGKLIELTDTLLMSSLPRRVLHILGTTRTNLASHQKKTKLNTRLKVVKLALSDEMRKSQDRLCSFSSDEEHIQPEQHPQEQEKIEGPVHFLVASHMYHILQDATKRALYGQFLDKKFCPELLMVLVEISAYINTESTQQRKEKGASIIHDFFTPEAENEVNITHRERKQLAQTVDTGDLNIFDETVINLLSTLHNFRLEFEAFQELHEIETNKQALSTDKNELQRVTRKKLGLRSFSNGISKTISGDPHSRLTSSHK